LEGVVVGERGGWCRILECKLAQSDKEGG